MAQLLDIQKVVVAPDALRATVRVSEGAPLRTSENVEATARVYWLMPAIADHVCLGEGGTGGDAGEAPHTFQDVMGDTDLAHLMEHVTIELIALTNLGGDISNARTHSLETPRTYEIELACPDDVLVASALSSAAWILQWAFGSADEESTPNVDAIVAGIANLVSRSFDMPGNEALRPERPAEPAVGEVEIEEVEVGGMPVRPLTGDTVAVSMPLAPNPEDVALEEIDELADYDIVMGNDAPDDVIEAVDDVVGGGEVEGAAVRTISGEVGFIDLAEDDPLAERLD